MSRGREHLLIAATLEQMKVADEFERLPAHMTVIGWFVLGKVQQDKFLLPLMERQFDQTNVYQSGLIEDQKFYGTDEQIESEEIPVSTLKGIEALPWQAHYALLRSMGELLPPGSPFNDHFSPHISETDDFRGVVDQPITFGSVALFSKQMGTDDRNLSPKSPKRVIASFDPRQRRDDQAAS